MPDATSTPTPAPATGSIKWIHTDTRGIGAATAAAYTRALSMKWTNDDSGVQDQRALVLFALMSSAALSAQPPALDGNSVVVNANVRAGSTDAQDWQTTLIWGVVLLLGVSKADVTSGRMNLTARVSVETEDGQIPSGPVEDTSFPFLAAIAIVSAVSALAGVLALYLSQRNEIDATKIASDERIQKHAAALASAASVVDAHTQAEAVAGASLPWDDEQKKYLDDLKASIDTLSATPTPVLKSVPNLASVSDATAGAIKDVGAGVKTGVAATGIGFGTVAALAVAFFLWEESEKSSRRAA